MEATRWRPEVCVGTVQPRDSQCSVPRPVPDGVLTGQPSMGLLERLQPSAVLCPTCPRPPPISPNLQRFHRIPRYLHPRVGCPACVSPLLETRWWGSSDCCLARPSRGLSPAGRGSAPSHYSVCIPGRVILVSSLAEAASAPRASCGSWTVGTRGSPAKPWRWGTCFQRRCLQPASVRTTASGMWSAQPPALLPGDGLSSLGGARMPCGPGGPFAQCWGTLPGPHDHGKDQGRVHPSAPQGRPRNAVRAAAPTHTHTVTRRQLNGEQTSPAARGPRSPCTYRRAPC